MKTLPDSPDLDHLRRQAKDLLAGLRDESPAATLTDAQTALAQQYGFRTWPELKAEVDRLSGVHDTADPRLAAAIAEAYGLGRVTGPMRSLGRADDVGRPWSLSTDRGRWAFRSVENWWPIVAADRDVELQQAASAAGVLLPAPMRSVNGEIVEQINGRPWRVNAWRHSGPPLTAPVSARIASQVGAVLATIHGLGLVVDRISPWHAARLSDEPWGRVAARVRSAGVPWAALFDAAVPELERLSALGAAPVDASAALLTHNSLGPAKVRRESGGQLVVFGWEHAGGQPPSWELADALSSWTLDADGAVNLAAARAMVEGYAARAGSIPPLAEGSFRGRAMSLCNYVLGEFDQALEAHRAVATGSDPNAAERCAYAVRNVTHLLTRLPTRADFGRLLTALDRRVSSGLSGRR